MAQDTSRTGRARRIVAALSADLAGCLRFYSRLPVAALPWEDDIHRAPDFRTMPRMLPLAGAIIGALGAVPLGLALSIGLDPFVAATVAIATIAAVTGALHEDGLADTADGFGGGRDTEHRLAIMKDSRIGSYGAAALVLALLLRIGGLAGIANSGGVGAAAAALMFTAALSRTAGLALLWVLPPARPGGASHAVGRPTGATILVAAMICLILALVTVLMGVPEHGLGLGILLSAGVVAVVARLSKRLIGGQTGDVIGATQQGAEVAILLALSGSLSR